MDVSLLLLTVFCFGGLDVDEVSQERFFAADARGFTRMPWRRGGGRPAATGRSRFLIRHTASV